MNDFLNRLKQAVIQPRPQLFRFGQQAANAISQNVQRDFQRQPVVQGFNRLPQPIKTFGASAFNQVRNDVTTGAPAMFRMANLPLNTIQQRQRGVGEFDIFKNQTTDAFNAAKLGSYALGAPRLATKAGAVALGTSGALGGGINKAFGGSFAEGAGQGVGMTPSIMGITRFTNPLVEKGVSKFAPQANNAVGKFLSQGTARGVLNVPEGALIDASLGRRPLGLESVGLDFATGFLGKSTPTRGTQSDAVNEAIKKGKALGIKGINPRAFSMHSDDLQEAKNALDILRGQDMKSSPEDKKYALTTVQHLLDSYAPGYSMSKNASAYKVLEFLIQTNEQVPKELKTKLPGMGLVGKADAQSPQPLGGANQMVSKTDSPKTRIALQKQQSKVQKLSPEERTTQQLLEAQQVAPSKSVGSNVPDVGGKQPPSVSGSRSSKYSYNINKTRLQLTKAQQKTLDEVVDRVKPELAQVKGAKITNEEVINAAKKSEVLTKVTTREETLQAEAALLRARQRLTELDKNIDTSLRSGNAKQVEAQMKDMIESLRVVSSNAADAGRRLQSFSIEATDESVRTQILREVGKTNAKTDEILKEAAKVDWNNGKSVTQFYRKFVKPSMSEILDEYRYNNMLSSPKTHIRNVFSNVTQAYVVRPMTLVFEGRPVEAGKYFTGAVKGLPEAYTAFTKAFKGDSLIEKPDLPHISTGKIPGVLTIPSRLLEAGDKFFTALIRNGEMARGKTAQEGEATAEYFLFRQGLKPEHQGQVLNAIDSMTAWTYKAPKAVRWFVPFIRTPMNFAKQWVEYSPTGYATMIGAGNKREQFAKATLGSTITLMGAMLAAQDRTTWAAPTDAKQKELFYASGKKPFSVRVGDRWVPMQYAGGLAMALAMPAAMKYYQEDSRTALSDSQLEIATRSATSMAEFLAGQTFMEGIGNFVKFFSGDADYGFGSNLGFTAGQVIPMQGLIRYINTIVDPVYRKGGGFVESIQSGIPGLSQSLESYKLPSGEESRRDPLNYPLPYDTGKVDPQYEQPLEARTKYLQNNAVINKNKKAVEGSGSTSSYDNTIYYSDPESGESGSINLSKVLDLPESNKYEIAIKESEKFTTANQIMNSPLSDSEKQQYLDQIGVNYNEAQYYNIASQNTNEKSLFVTEKLNQMVQQNVSQDQFMQYLVNLRKSVNGDRVAADGVIDNLVEDGYIPYEVGKQLKKVKPEVNDDIRSGKVKAKGSGGKKVAAIKPPAFKEVKSTPIKLQRLKFGKVQLGRSKKNKKKIRILE